MVLMLNIYAHLRIITANLPPACLAYMAPVFTVQGVQKKMMRPNLKSARIGSISVSPAPIMQVRTKIDKSPTKQVLIDARAFLASSVLSRSPAIKKRPTTQKMATCPPCPTRQPILGIVAPAVSANTSPKGRHCATANLLARPTKLFDIIYVQAVMVRLVRKSYRAIFPNLVLSCCKDIVGNEFVSKILHLSVYEFVSKILQLSVYFKDAFFYF